MKGRLIMIALGILFGLCLMGLENFSGHIRGHRVSDGRAVDFETLIGEISKADIIFTGEIHDSERHHRLQLETIRRLSEGGLPVTVGFEMFPKESQATLDGWITGTVSLKDFMRFYETHWNQSWPLYRDIFLYARDNKIPLLALNIPRDISQKVRQSGFSSLSGKEMSQLPPGLSCSVDEKYMKYIRKAFAYHDNDENLFVHFCEAQLLWDKSMAWYLLDYLGRHPGRKVVVITGITHAWKKGIPDQLRQFQGDNSYQVLLPEIPGAIEPGRITSEDADYIFLK